MLTLLLLNWDWFLLWLVLAVSMLLLWPALIVWLLILWPALIVLPLPVRNDRELSKFLSGVTIASGGVMPNVHSVLLPKKSKSKKMSQ